MKSAAAAILLGLASFASAAEVPVLYELQVDASDGAGAALNAAIQSKFASAKKVLLFSDASRKDPPRLRLVVRILKIDELAEPTSAWEAIWLMENEDQSNTWLNTWMGYTGIPKAPDMADIIVNGVHKDIDALTNKP